MPRKDPPNGPAANSTQSPAAGLTTEQPAFAEWAIVEVMGHQKYIGRVTEHVIAGHGFVRVDVPASEKIPEFTKIIGPGSIYAITPVSEAIARHLATNAEARPVSAWDLPQIAAPADDPDDFLGDDD